MIETMNDAMKRVKQEHPLCLDDWGEWTENEESKITLTPSRAPWRGLLEILEKMDVDGPTPDMATESDAIVAIFWRYGSFAHALTCGRRHTSFRADESISRVGNSEMHRINLEFSAGLAYWWEISVDPERKTRIVNAAIRHLPMPWAKRRSDMWTGYGVSGHGLEYAQKSGGRLQAFVAEQVEKLGGWEGVAEMDTDKHSMNLLTPMTIRQQANHIVNARYRNGSQIEDLHSGSSCDERDTFGYKRLYSDEVMSIAKKIVQGLQIDLGYRKFTDERSLTFMRRMDTNNSVSGRWSENDETCLVPYNVPKK